MSTDGLELYFTRFLIGGLSTEICVSVRNSPTDTFSVPQVLISDFPNVPEAASPNTQMTLMYYHKKINGTYAIHMRQRIATGVEEHSAQEVNMFPNPAGETVSFSRQQERVEVFNAAGQLVVSAANTAAVSISHLPEGSYTVRCTNAGITAHTHLTICR